MSDRQHHVTGAHRIIGSIALLLVVLALIFNVAFYAYARPGGILTALGPVADVREKLLAAYVDEPDDDALIEAAIRGMVDSLGDKHTVYMNQQELDSFNDHVRGEFSGIGAEIDIHDNRLRIVAPLQDSPAWQNGVMAGDMVMKIEGQDTEGITILEAQQKLMGPPGTQVTITVRHRSGEEETLTITRDTIKVASVRGYRRNAGNGYEYMLDKQSQIGYVKLTQFGDGTVNEFNAALAKLSNQGMKGLILDLRDNGGGLLDAAVALSDLFLTQDQTIVTIRSRIQPEQVYRATDATPYADLPLVVLVNEYSASASEILAGALLDNGRALVVGTRTYGKGSVQQVVEIEGSGGALKLTTAYWYVPSGRLIHRMPDAEQWGVDPSPGDYVPMTIEQVEQMIDRKRANEADDPFEDLDGPITPAWIDEQLLDPQLAAALRAMQQRVGGGDWPSVGLPMDAALQQATERDQLERQRAQYQQALERIEQELAALNGEPIDEEAALPDGAIESIPPAQPAEVE